MQLTAEITNYTNMQLKAETPTPPTSSDIYTPLKPEKV